MREPWTDLEMLTALDMRDHSKATATQIARVLGKSRSAVLGIFKRLNDEALEPSPHDGTMPRRWWQQGGGS